MNVSFKHCQRQKGPKGWVLLTMYPPRWDTNKLGTSWVLMKKYWKLKVNVEKSFCRAVAEHGKLLPSCQLSPTNGQQALHCQHQQKRQHQQVLDWYFQQPKSHHSSLPSITDLFSEPLISVGDDQIYLKLNVVISRNISLNLELWEVGLLGELAPRLRAVHFLTK